MIVIKMRLKTIAAPDEGSRRSMYDSFAGAFALEHTITERYDERRVVQSIPNHQECNIIKQRKSMKRYLSCATVLMSLSACSSAGKLRDTVPTAVYVGSSSASDVVSCVSSAWATKHFQIDTVPLNTGTSLQLTENDGGPIMALVDITPTAGGTTTAKYYSQMPDDDTWFFQQVKSCM